MPKSFTRALVALLLSLSLSAAWGQARVIVKYKDTAVGGTSQRQVLSATGAAPVQRAAALGQRAGLGLADGPAISSRTQVVTAQGMSSAALAQRLASLPEVEYAIPDQFRHPTALPNDPLFASGGGAGPASGQWYLKTPGGGNPVAAIDAQRAWDLVPGGSVVVAVLDTGVRPDHADLQANLLMPGVDMIHEPLVANDLDGRDNDASDPGDWVDAQDRQNNSFYNQCSLSPFSTWHGTGTSALIGAVTDNATGMAGVGRGHVSILPIRVLGKCGGYDSDIVAGMLWAVGQHVSGVTDNTNPAKVLNLSLGSAGACTQLYLDAIKVVTDAGAVIVVAAGNSTGHAVSAPANCPGVIAVGGVRHVGSKVGFSDLGPEVALTAPAGNCVNDPALGQPCLFPILTATNPGTTTPVAHGSGGSTYTNETDYSIGTSFSAPLVAGTAALMLARNPNLQPEDVRNLLRTTVRAFPTSGGTSGTQACRPPDGNSQLECYCTALTCGTGMLDANASVAAAASAASTGLLARISAVDSPAPQTVTLSAADSVTGGGRTINQYRWSAPAGAVSLSSVDQATTTATVPSSGSFVVQLTVTDTGGNTAKADQTFTVEVPQGGGGGGAIGGAWLAGLLAGILALQALRQRDQAALRKAAADRR